MWDGDLMHTPDLRVSVRSLFSLWVKQLHGVTPLLQNFCSLFLWSEELMVLVV